MIFLRQPRKKLLTCLFLLSFSYACATRNSNESTADSIYDRSRLNETLLQIVPIPETLDSKNVALCFYGASQLRNLLQGNTDSDSISKRFKELKLLQPKITVEYNNDRSEMYKPNEDKPYKPYAISYEAFREGLRDAINQTKIDLRVDAEVPPLIPDDRQTQQNEARKQALKSLEQKVADDIKASKDKQGLSETVIKLNDKIDGKIDVIASVQAILDQAATQKKLTTHECEINYTQAKINLENYQTPRNSRSVDQSSEAENDGE